MRHLEQFSFDNEFQYEPLSFGPVILCGLGEMDGMEYKTKKQNETHCFEIYYMVSGNACLSTKNRSFPLARGSVFVNIVGEKHIISFERDAMPKLFYIRFKTDDLTEGNEKLLPICDFFINMPSPCTSDKFNLRSMFLSLFTEFSSNFVLRETVIKSVLEQILIFTYRDFLQDDRKNHAIKIAQKTNEELVYEMVAHIDKNIVSMNNLSELSKHFNYTYPYLSQVFSRVMKYPLKEYFYQKRFEKAAELLRDNVSVTKISEMLGYESIHSFSRAFKKQTGMAPTAYKSEHREGGDTPVSFIIDDFNDEHIDWHIDNIYGSARNVLLVSAPSYSGEQAGAFYFDATADWRVDQYKKTMPPLRSNDYKYLSFWAKATEEVTTTIVLGDERGIRYSSKVHIDGEAALYSMALSSFVSEEGESAASIAVSFVSVMFFGVDNINTPNVGIVYLDMLQFTGFDISEILEIPSGLDFVNVAEYATRIAMAPTVIAVPSTLADVDDCLDRANRPACMLMTVHQNLSVVSVEGYPLGNISAVYAKIHHKIMPAFYVHSPEATDSLAQYLNEKKYQDVFVVSSHEELVCGLREKCFMVRGVIDFMHSVKTPDEMAAICNAAMSRVVLISDRVPKEDIMRMQAQQITVWVCQSASASHDTVSMHRMLTSGANGVAVSEPAQLYNAMSLYSHNQTLLRRVHIIGYRGVPHLAPENTLESAEKAFEAGADAIVAEIAVTKDNQLVVLYDPTLDRTTDGEGLVIDKNWSEISHLKASKGFEEQFPDARLPLLSDYYAAFADTELRLFVDIISNEQGVVRTLKKLTQDMQMQNRVTFVSNAANQLLRMRRAMPSVSLGNLSIWLTDNDIAVKSIKGVMSELQMFDTTLCPICNDSHMFVNFVRQIRHRGVTVWPHNFIERDTVTDFFLLGMHGLTVAHAEWFSDWMSELRAFESTIRMAKGECRRAYADMRTYDRRSVKVSPEAMLLKGDSVKINEGSVLCAQKSGESYLLLRHTYHIDDARRYDMYTQPVRVVVQ